MQPGEGEIKREAGRRLTRSSALKEWKVGYSADGFKVSAVSAWLLIRADQLKEAFACMQVLDCILRLAMPAVPLLPALV